MKSFPSISAKLKAYDQMSVSELEQELQGAQDLIRQTRADTHALTAFDAAEKALRRAKRRETVAAKEKATESAKSAATAGKEKVSKIDSLLKGLEDRNVLPQDVNDIRTVRQLLGLVDAS